MSYYSQQQHRRYLRQLAATQNKPRAIARTQSQQRNSAAQRLRLVAVVATATVLWVLWQMNFGGA